MTAATKIALLNSLFLALLVLGAMAGWVRFPVLISYPFTKILHLSGLVLFFGNMIAGPVWLMVAWYSGDMRLIRYSFRLLKLTDMWLTIPGVDLMVLSGLSLASLFGGEQTPWIYNSMLAMLALWVLALPVVYYQEKIYRQLENPEIQTVMLEKNVNWWGIWGTLVLLPVILVFYFMVFKPT